MKPSCRSTGHDRSCHRKTVKLKQRPSPSLFRGESGRLFLEGRFMICDTLQHLTRYKGLCKNLDTAIDYLLTTTLPACLWAAPRWMARRYSSTRWMPRSIRTMATTRNITKVRRPAARHHRQRGLGLYHKSRQGDRRFYRRLRFSGQRQCRDRHTGRRTLCAVLPHGAAQTRPCTARLCGRAQGCCKDSDGGLNDG